VNRRPLSAFRRLGPIGAVLAVVLVAAVLAGSVVAIYGPWPGRTGLPAAWAALFGPRVVAITVDDGPTATYTPQVLALLKSHNVTATFFVIGRLAEEATGLIRAELAQGCTIGTHTWSHPRMGGLTDALCRSEVIAGARAVERVTGQAPLYFRPPRGVLTTAEQQAASELGMRTVFWDASLDHQADKTPQEAATRVLDGLVPGDIILLHDGAGDRAKTMQALAILLDGLAARGFRVVPLDQLPL
jgi:peptidoglycan-N-acetylglucosamine deacetylase